MIRIGAGSAAAPATRRAYAVTAVTGWDDIVSYVTPVTSPARDTPYSSVTFAARNRRRQAMTKGEMLAYSRDMSAEDQRKFDRWIKANAAIATIVAMGFVAMALAGVGADADSIGPRSAIADVRPAANPPSPYVLMLRLAPGELPVEQVDEPF
jgi:hypothetical protein